LADEIWGMAVGLAVAIAIGLIGLMFSWIREKKLDRFVLLDTLLLVLLSALSYIFDNEIFFKVKPAMINVVLAALIALSLFTKIDPLGSMSQKLMGGMAMNGNQKDLFRKNLYVMFWLVIFHTFMVIGSAFLLKKEVWAFISSFGLFIMMGGYLGFEIFRHKFLNKKLVRLTDAEEWLPVVDEEGKILGKAQRSYCHNGSKTLHPVIHLHLIGSNNTIYLQKRSNSKLVQPGKWDTAVGGHISFGETIEDALKREAEEEIGLKVFDPKPVLKYRWDSELESEMVYCFITKSGTPLVNNPEEVTEGRFWKITDIQKNIGKGLFTPNFEYEFLLLQKAGVIAGMKN
jgi:isopentenyldiphosphate isomerase/intracellular septation protein A